MVSYTLSELCNEIGEALDSCLAPSYWVKAEVNSLSEKGGHMYLDLVEGKTAKMRATCWAGNKELLMAYFESETGQRLQAGMAVLVEVEIQWHAVYGISLSIVGIDPSYTLGDIARQRQRTIAQLQADGLLEAQQLLPLPTLIRRIIIAALEEISNLQTFKQSPKDSNPQTYDSVVIIRGGGAVSDLSCFDDYTLCAVCAQYELPILTGIGHTRDVSILDMVAHETLKTPTAVAEFLIHRMDAQKARLDDLLMRLRRTADRQILIRRHRIEMLEQRLAACNPERIYRMGYSLLSKNGKVIRSVQDLQTGDVITTHLADGNVLSAVL